MFRSFRESAQELRKVGSLTVIGLLVALAVVFQFFSIQVNEYIKISFSMLPLSAVGMLFGPIPAGLAAVASDLIGCIIKPTGPYFFGFTFNAFLGGVFYGILLYRRPASVWRVCVCKMLIMVIINLGFTSVWLYLLYNQAFSVYVPMRLVKNLVMYPIECAMIYASLQVVRRVSLQVPRR